MNKSSRSLLLNELISNSVVAAVVVVGLLTGVLLSNDVENCC